MKDKRETLQNTPLSVVALQDRIEQLERVARMALEQLEEYKYAEARTALRAALEGSEGK